MTQVHIVQRLSPGGIEQLVLSMATKADMRLFSLEGTVDTLCRDWPVLEPLRDRITAFDKKPGRDALLPARISSALSRLAPGSVISHHTGPLVYGGLAARLAGVKRLVHVEHDAWHLESARRCLLVKGFLRLLGPRRIAVSAKVAASAERHTGMVFAIISNGVDCSRFLPGETGIHREALGLPVNRKIIGAAGRLETVKGFDLLIRAAPHLDPDTLIVIWGDGSRRGELQELITDLQVEDRVRLAGSANVMEKIYPSMDLLCLPSRNEGLPLALLEAQACNVPVVAHDVGGIGEGVCPVSGRMVDYRPDDNEIASDAQARRLALALREHLPVTGSSSPRSFVENRYSFSKMLNAYLCL